MDTSIKQGFLGQRMIVLPKNITQGIKKNPLIAPLYFTDIGFFPHASHHEVRRKNGSKQHILIYCYKGEGIIEVGGSVVTLKANTYYIIPPGVPHSYYALETNPWSIYWVHFTGAQAVHFYDKFSSRFAESAPLLSLEERRLSLFESLIGVLESGYSEANLEFVNLSLTQLLNAFLYDRFFTEVGKQLSENNTVEAAIEYMKKHLDSPLKIDDVAGNFSYSPSHFFTLFKKRTGYSPIHYFNYLKIQKACQYLSFTTMSVKEISFALGFNDPLYFSRLFKKIMSTPPLQYRNEYRH
ncbi:AraC family transcriptional regulator [Flavobacterium akiainvivens]|uniref:AraC family transcriptional regulator n=1 Tax=Flavobacterium akiainvivens TaxID=1202724 RepID=A0A0M8M8Q0_9FLAO|nr:AraC family transcriptional regulator [Flavobacterium akiainvivens]KOS05843.1 AraC family transcriptional regulator [Flavobacterium akiainvivens]SFQ56891.1 AraC-like ligand binding domain-containing protein [Flavobacterium akiainvivens]